MLSGGSGGYDAAWMVFAERTTLPDCQVRWGLSKGLVNYKITIPIELLPRTTAPGILYFSIKSRVARLSVPHVIFWLEKMSIGLVRGTLAGLV